MQSQLPGGCFASQDQGSWGSESHPRPTCPGESEAGAAVEVCVIESSNIPKNLIFQGHRRATIPL